MKQSKVIVQGAICFRKLIENDLYSSTIFGSIQAGGKLKLMGNKINPSAGISFNPIWPIKNVGGMESMFVGFGTFIGVSTTVFNVEPALNWTYIFSNTDYT